MGAKQLEAGHTLVSNKEIDVEEFLKEQENSHKPKKVLAVFPSCEVEFRGKTKNIENEAKWCSNWFWNEFHGVTQFSKDWKIIKFFKSVYRDNQTGLETVELSCSVEEYEG